MFNTYVGVLKFGFDLRPSILKILFFKSVGSIFVDSTCA